jgi:hypothetical protein
MAWITTTERPTGTSYRVRWREIGRRKHLSKSFPTVEDAERFRSEIEKAWPHKSKGPRPGSPRAFKSLTERIESSVQKDENGCWLWARKVGKPGYGLMTTKEAGKPRTRLAHRVSYEAFVGAIPAGLQLDHLCRVRACVNPEHLEPVTLQENLYRSPIHNVRFRAEGKCSQGHVLADVGTYKAGKYRTCKPLQSTAKR